MQVLKINAAIMLNLMNTTSNQQVPFQVTPRHRHEQIRKQITPEVLNIFSHSNALCPGDHSDHQKLQNQSILPKKSNLPHNIPKQSIAEDRPRRKPKAAIYMLHSGYVYFVINSNSTKKFKLIK